MERLCAVKGIAGDRWILIGYAEIEDGNMVLVRHAYTTPAGQTTIQDIFGSEIKVSHHILHVSRLWFRKSDVVFAD